MRNLITTAALLGSPRPSGGHRAEHRKREIFGGARKADRALS
jgi:hypothetical protein